YVNQFVPDLEKIGEDLIEQALNAVLKNQVDFGFDTDLELIDGELLINQISFTLNLMKQSPPPSKTAQQLAAELGAEIQRLQQKRQETLGSADVTQGLVSNDGLSISSGWTSTRRPKSSDTQNS
ncbi:MAG TPA: hypothetical protein IGR64_18805, partial [Leptolyngbyaceae cyanobacterium M65_K2018_010]|nr:hypothetical protein [Leptolyngbyaceae cyanobacterium M65_K2018_010]